MLLQRVSVCSCDATPPIKVENVPAYVCELCSEQTLPGSTVEVFERIRQQKVGLRRFTSLAVVDFDSAERGERAQQTAPMTFIESAHMYSAMVPDDSTTTKGEAFIVASHQNGTAAYAQR